MLKHKIIRTLSMIAIAVGASSALFAAEIRGLDVVNKSTIIWSENGWMEVQNRVKWETVVDINGNKCQGFISSCTVSEEGPYDVINHSNTNRTNNIFVKTGDACTAAPYSFPSVPGWYQLQDHDYNSVCYTGGTGTAAPPCEGLEPGNYQLLRFHGGTVDQSSVSLQCSEPGNKPAIVSPINGSTIASSSFTLNYLAGTGAPTNRKFDIHGSAYPQPTTDAESYGNDLFDSNSIGSVLSWRVEEIPPGTTQIYGRIRYTDNDFQDNDTTVADGRFVDFEYNVDINKRPNFTAPTAGSTLTSNTVQLAWDWDRRIDIQIHDSDPGSVAGDGLDDTSGFTAANSSWETTQSNGNYWIRVVWPDVSNVWPDDPQDNYDAGRYLTFQITIDAEDTQLSGIDRTGIIPIVVNNNIDRPNYGEPELQEFWGSAGMSSWFELHDDLISSKTIDGIDALELNHVIKADGTGGTENIATAGLLDVGFVQRMKVVQRVRVGNDFDLGAHNAATMKAGLGIRSSLDSSGGRGQAEGFTVRPIFRRSAGKEYYGLYVYDGDTTGFGDDYRSNVELILGEWVEIAIEVEMNSAYGVNDGVMRHWINGQLVLERTTHNFIDKRRAGDPSVPSIRGVSLTSFHGGSNSTAWSPATNQLVAYGDMGYSVD